MPTPRATIDVFESQRSGRRRTAVLLAWFAVAIAAVVAMAYAAVLLFPWVASGGAAPLWRPDLLAAVAAVVVGIVAVGGAYHSASVARGGGDAIAESLGGVAVERASIAPAERRLLNVLEEVSIAAGLPVPKAFVLPAEEGMNAFAAGTTPGHAVVAVTRGALDGLPRDELQAVVAHEIGHVVNGDTLLNARLMGMVGGLTFLSLMGRETLRLAWPESRAGWHGRLLLLPTGLVLAAAGWIGVLGGQLVRCAVSREREFLADAGAARLTRHPEALASALLRIARHGSALHAPRAVETSHFFFADPLAARWRLWMSTHPPIAERVRRLAPAAFCAGDVEGGAPAPARAREGRRDPGAFPREPAAPGPAERAAPASSTEAGGRLSRARGILAKLPPALVAAARDPLGARALVTALRLAPGDDVRAAALGSLEARDASAAARVRALCDDLARLAAAERLALLDLTLPSLDALPPGDVQALQEDLASVEPHGADGLFEWMLRRAVARRLERRLSGGRTGPVLYRTVSDVDPECLQLLSMLAWAGARDVGAARAALGRGLSALGRGGGWAILPRERLDLGAADAALRQLDRAAPAVKERVVRACAAVVASDGRLTDAEAELLRAVTASLGWPMLPILPGALRAGAPAAIAPAA